MHIRAVRLNVRNPIVGAALLIAAVVFVLVFLVFGFALLAGAVVVGTVAALVHRVLRPLKGRSPRVEPLDSAQEVFPRDSADERLPPGRGE
jgi:ABC-type transport system involved in cytochrome bd biosynthesis fused ATPase/permease subunit